MKLAQLIIVILFACYVGAKECQPNQIRFGHACYQLLNELLQWPHAQEACLQLGAQAGIVIPNSIEEKEFIQEKFTNRAAYPSRGIWVGCKFLEQKWMRADKEDEECSYFDSPRPSNKKGACAMWDNSESMWASFSCDHQRVNTLCEIPSSPTMSCVMQNETRDFFTTHCLTLHVLDGSSIASETWASVCRDEPRCLSFNLRRVKSLQAILSCRPYPATPMDLGGGEACQYYYF